MITRNRCVTKPCILSYTSSKITKESTSRRGETLKTKAQKHLPPSLQNVKKAQSVQAAPMRKRIAGRSYHNNKRPQCQIRE